jgi:signal transduction histidine kinase
VLSVTDNGIGMSPADLERALQPFGQAQAATTRAQGGTGLGLPITKGLVEAHGGTLEISSSPGRGTRIRIVLPAERTRANHEPKIAAQA